MSEANGEVSTELTQDKRAYAGLAQALMISTWWIGPLIIFRVHRKSRFVSFHALQALFWQIIFALLSMVGMGMVVVAGLASVVSAPQGKTPESGQFPIALFVAFPIFWLTIINGFAISMTLGIMDCLKAMRGEWAGYPLIGNGARQILRD
jgi:uncharacterized membrane protein